MRPAVMLFQRGPTFEPLFSRFLTDIVEKILHFEKQVKYQQIGILVKEFAENIILCAKIYVVQTTDSQKYLEQFDLLCGIALIIDNIIIL